MSVGEEFTSPQALCPQSKKQAALVSERLVFAAWKLLVCPKGSHSGAQVPPESAEEVSSQGAGKGRFAAQPPGCNKAWVFFGVSTVGSKEEPDWHSQPRVCCAPQGTKPSHCLGRAALGTARPLTWRPRATSSCSPMELHRRASCMSHTTSRCVFPWKFP